MASSSSNELDGLIAGLQNYVVAPLNAFGLGGFVFDIEGESQAKLEAEITDHYTEDNKAVQDHIARKPKIITLRGYVGEVVYKGDGQSVTRSAIQTVTQKLSSISAFLPQVSASTKQTQSLVSDTSIGFNEGFTSTADIYGMVENLIGTTGDTANQQKAYMYFKACWEQGVLMAIQTPWEFLTNMAIQNVVALQTENSTEISDFSVTYKQMRFAKTSSTAYAPSSQASSGNGSSSPQLQGAASLQSQLPVSIGNVAGIALPSNILSGIQGTMTNVTDLFSVSNISQIFE